MLMIMIDCAHPTGHPYFANCGERRGMMLPASRVVSVLKCQHSRVVRLQKAANQRSFGFDLIGPQQMVSCIPATTQSTLPERYAALSGHVGRSASHARRGVRAPRH